MSSGIIDFECDARVKLLILIYLRERTNICIIALERGPVFAVFWKINGNE